MRFDIHGYLTHRATDMDIYLPGRRSNLLDRTLLYAGGNLWNGLPSVVKMATSLQNFKTLYKKHVIPHTLPLPINNLHPN